jgi:hypothetical protein
VWTDGDKTKTDLPYDLAWIASRSAGVWDAAGHDSALLLNSDGVIISKVDVTRTN